MTEAEFISTLKDNLKVHIESRLDYDYYGTPCGTITSYKIHYKDELISEKDEIYS